MEISLADFRKMRKRAGVCRDCGRVDAFTMVGRTYCAVCAETGREKKRKDRADPEKAEKLRQEQKRIRERRKENGDCVYCGKRKAEDGYVTCGRCREKQRKRREEKRRERGIYGRGTGGLCWKCCKKPVIPGRAICQDCYDKNMRVLKAVHPNFNY